MNTLLKAKKALSDYLKKNKDKWVYRDHRGGLANYYNLCIDCKRTTTRKHCQTYHKRNPDRNSFNSLNKRLRREGEKEVTNEQWEIILERKEEFTRLTGRQFRGPGKNLVMLLNDDYWYGLMSE